MAAEEAHELGREGVYKVKQFLESTTHLNMPWTAYDHTPACRLQRLDGTKKTYDLHGFFLGKKRCPLYVEAKKYTTPGGQGSLYVEYLADVYSITAKARAEDMDQESEFMWITWHPFSQKDWIRLLSHQYVRESVLKHPEHLALDDGVTPEEFVDDDLCRVVAERLWIIVLGDRQQELVLSPRELKIIMASIDRDGA